MRTPAHPANRSRSSTGHREYTNRIEGFATQLATLDGLERVSPGRNLQFIPYAAAGSSHFLNTPSYEPPSYVQQYDHRAGLDAKAILHDSFTLDVTLNPDFSQVESDDPQVTVNQRFEVLFPEKRPFFLDNANYFQTPENLFFSRRIGNPEYGARLTGREGPWLAGFLVIDDRAPGQQLAPDDPGAGKRALIAVARVQREFWNQSTVGALVTDYQFGGSSEQVFSLDTRLRLWSNLVFTGQAVRSQADYTGGSHPQGSIFHAELSYVGLHLTARSVLRTLGPDFVSTLSYIPRVDIRQGVHNLAWKWLPSHRILKSYGPTLDVTEDWNHAGALQDWIVSPGVAFEQHDHHGEENGSRGSLSIPQLSEAFHRFQREQRDLEIAGGRGRLRDGRRRQLRSSHWRSAVPRREHEPQTAPHVSPDPQDQD